MKETTNVKSGYLCHCLQITEERFDEMVAREPRPTYAGLKAKYGIGTVCTSCEYEAKGKLAELAQSQTEQKPWEGGLRAELGYAWGEMKRKAATLLHGPPKARPPRNYHTGIFFLRRDGLESHLVIANLRFPEHAANVNGAEVTFRATLYGEDGRTLATSALHSVVDGVSVELTPAELFPQLTGDYTGWLYAEFKGLIATGSLRPYGVMVNTVPDFRARCHYHDKYGKFQEPGFIHSSSVLEPGQIEYIALANGLDEPYETPAHLKAGGRTYTTQLSVPPRGALWRKVEDLFPERDRTAAGPALFWLADPRHVMVYFFWYNPTAKSWMGQHH